MSVTINVSSLSGSRDVTSGYSKCDNMNYLQLWSMAFVVHTPKWESAAPMALTVEESDSREDLEKKQRLGPGTAEQGMWTFCLSQEVVYALESESPQVHGEGDRGMIYLQCHKYL